ncbi:MAG: DUF1850 domain-containing protein [Candidatus Methylomirabilales bacterium]
MASSGLLLAALALVAWAEGGMVLELIAVPAEQVVLCAEASEGEEFVLSFVHSVNRRPVYDTFQVRDGELVILKSRFDSFGAGMPEASTDAGTLRVLPDGWLEWTVNRPVPEVIVRVGLVARHELQIRNTSIALADVAAPGTALAFRVRRVSADDAVKGRCLR